MAKPKPPQRRNLLAEKKQWAAFRSQAPKFKPRDRWQENDNYNGLDLTSVTPVITLFVCIAEAWSWEDFIVYASVLSNRFGIDDQNEGRKGVVLCSACPQWLQDCDTESGMYIFVRDSAGRYTRRGQPVPYTTDEWLP